MGVSPTPRATMLIDTNTTYRSGPLAPRECLICRETFEPAQEWQKVCFKPRCKLTRQNQREARSAFLLRIARQHGPSFATIERVYARQEGVCLWCRLPFRIHPRTRVPVARWIPLSEARGFFACPRCTSRVSRLRRLYDPTRRMDVREAIGRLMGLLEGVDALWSDMRGSARATADARRRARFATRLERLAVPAGDGGADLG